MGDGGKSGDAAGAAGASSNTGGGAPSAEQKDLYAILGVTKSATEKDLKEAYKKLALKYHPDRNAGCEEAAEKFKEISTAYAVLTDPNKRRQYDVTGDSPEVTNDSYDLETAGTTTRVIGAMFTRMGFSIHTEVGPTTLMTGQEICRAPRIDKDPRVTPLVVGHPTAGVTDRQQGVFYHFKLTEEQQANGIIITCCSPNRSRFKLLLFDSTGSVRYVQESSYTLDKKFTAATIYTSMETTSLGDPVAPITKDDTPPIFNRLSTLIKENRMLDPGDHLVCVYGDNWLQKCSFTLSLLNSVRDPVVMESVKTVDDLLLQKKGELEILQREYEDLKAKFEKLNQAVEAKEKETDALLQERENVYNDLIGKSLEASLRASGTSPAEPVPPREPVRPTSASFRTLFTDLIGGGRR